MPIVVPAGVKISVSADNLVTVEGKLGKLVQEVSPLITMKQEDGHFELHRVDETQEARAKHGLYRSLIANMVTGVSEGFTIVQELVGVGFKANAVDNLLELALGYSHNFFFELPSEIKVTAVTERGKNPIITMVSHDKQLIGQVAAKLRSLRKPEPYKGKGIRFKGEIVKKKAGKSASDK